MKGALYLPPGVLSRHPSGHAGIIFWQLLLYDVSEFKDHFRTN
jgi:hypothetical protein